MHIFKSRAFRLGAGALVSIALYALLGFVIAPKLVRSALLEDIPANISATPTVGEIHINPFLLQATVDNFALVGADGGRLVSFQRLFIDFQLSSLWHRAYTFLDIDITAPQVSALIAQDGRLNLLQLQPKPTTNPGPKAGGGPLPALRIGSFKVSRGSVSYEDRSRPEPFAARLEPINFELHDFTTGIEGGQFTLTGASKLGERVEFHGHLSVEPLESDGEFQVSGLLAHTLWEYLQDQLNFEVDTGQIDIAATYKFSQVDPAVSNLVVALSNVSVTDLAVKAKAVGAEAGHAVGPEANLITVPEFRVTGTTVDLAKRQAHVDRVSLTGIKVVTWLEPDGSVNLMKLAQSVPAAAVGGTSQAPVAPTLTASPVAGGAAAAGPAAAASPAWAFDLRQFEIRDASISAEDRSVKPAAKVLLAPLSLQLDGISQDLSKPVKLTFGTHINDKGSLNATGDVTPQTLLADVNVKLADLDLTVVQPYITQHTAMTLKSGTLSGDLKVHYKRAQDRPALQVVGSIGVAGVRSLDDDLHDDFVNWERVDVTGIDYGQNPDRLDIEQVLARRLYARVIVEADSSINAKRVLRIPIAVAGADDTSVTIATRGAPAPALRQTLPVSIKKVVLQDSLVNFTDLSIKPNFSAGIQKLEGSVSGLSSKPSSRAKVDFKGSVEPFAPVTINGDVNVLGPLYTDLTMGFHNISLAVFNPYSGKFAGYNITKGKLTTDLHYKIDGRKLDAQHHVVIEQLEFGEKTESKEAVSLPVKLAVALLRDRNGVIDLEVPVNGSLDDPKFRLAPIVWKVFVNILEKAVTAPFALLGSLFGGGPDVQFIPFQPGIAVLDPTGSEKASAIARALIERPQLKIDVPIDAVPALDRPALIEQQYGLRVSAAMPAKGGKTFDRLDAAGQAEILGKLYEQDVGAAPKFPESITGIKTKPELAAAKVDFLSKALRERIVVSDGDLQALGQRRALAVQTVLLADPLVAPERVFLVINEKAVAKDGAVQLELSLK